MSQALYRKWRPVSWDEVVGQNHIVQTLHNAVATGKVGHAYLFAGPRGTGKTTSARLLAKAVNCLDNDLAMRPCNACVNCVGVNQGRFLDLIEIDAASNTSVEDVRELRDKINFAPSQGRFKVYIIDEVHMLSTSAFNALLKTLEEPPPHVIFILATTEIHKIPATVLSRCQQHEFRRIPVQTIVEKLQLLCENEGIEINNETLTLIARQSTGSLRDAISLVDQLSSLTGEVTLEIAQDILGTATNQVVIDFIQTIIDSNSGEGLSKIHQALDAGSDPRQFARQVVEYLRSLLLVKMNLPDHIDAPLDVKKSMIQQAEAFELGGLINVINAFSNAASDLKANWQPGLGLELALANVIVKSLPARTTEINTQAESNTSANDAKVEGIKPLEKIKKVKTYQADPKPTLDQDHPKTDKPNNTVNPSSTEGMNLKTIQEKWMLVKETVKKENPITEALLNSSRLMGMHNDSLIISFSSDLLKDKMMAGKNINLTTKVMKQVFGKELRLECMVGNQSKIDNKPNFDFSSDGMVGTATRDLGAEIVEVD